MVYDTQNQVPEPLTEYARMIVARQPQPVRYVPLIPLTRTITSIGIIVLFYFFGLAFIVLSFKILQDPNKHLNSLTFENYAAFSITSICIMYIIYNMIQLRRWRTLLSHGRARAATVYKTDQVVRDGVVTCTVWIHIHASRHQKGFDDIYRICKKQEFNSNALITDVWPGLVLLVLARPQYPTIAINFGPLTPNDAATYNIEYPVPLTVATDGE